MLTAAPLSSKVSGRRAATGVFMLHTPIVAARKLLSDAAALDIAVIVPTRNEIGNIKPFLAALDAAFGDIVWEAIFVDDDSPDGTAALIREIGRGNIRVRVVQRIGRRGLSSAVIEGVMATCAPIVAVIDADMQHDETLLPRLFAAVRDGECDLAVGSRYAPGGTVGAWSAGRHAVSRWATRLGKLITGADLADPMSGYFVCSRAVFEAALPRLSATGFKILLDIIASVPTPPRIVEVPYTFRNRTCGESKLDLKVSGEYALFLLDKTLGRLVPIRLLLFGIVGSLGVGVHLALMALMLAAGSSFTLAETAAVIAAMTFNFMLNNIATYRDRRLHGLRLVTGLLSFYAVCAIGAVANVGIGSWINGAHQVWWLAGAAGALVGAVWNFSASSVVTWRR